MPIMNVECLDENNEKYYFKSIVGINYGFIADIDINSEFLRFLGNLRFDVYGHLKILAPNVYSSIL